MAITNITFTDKEQGQVNLLPIVQQCRYLDINEIKTVVNNNATELGTTNTNVSTNATNIGTNATDISNRIQKNIGATYTTNTVTTLTQAEYAALTPDANTLYFIV